MKKEEVKVLIADVEEAVKAKLILEALGEKVAPNFFPLYNNLMWYESGWYLTEANCGKTTVTLRQLIEILTRKEPDLLDGKCAIKINDKRELKLLMSYYEKMGWRGQNGNSAKEILILNLNARYPNMVWKYGQNFHSINVNAESYKIIPFSDFAKHIGIEVPVYVLSSEDGVDLYEGDKLFEVNRRGATKDWYLVNADNGKGFWIVGKQAPKWKLGEESGYVSKAFSTREAAEKWIAEQNKPKCIVVSDTDEYPVEVYKDKIRIKCSDSVNHKDNIMIYNKELTEIWNAYQSLQ